MDWLQFVSSVVASLAWPALVLVFVLLFREPIGELIGRLRTVKALGAEGTFDAKAAEVEATVALAESAATVTVQAAQAQAVIESTTTIEETTIPSVVYTVPDNTQMTTRHMDLAQRDPQAAILETYADVERIIKRAMDEAKVAGVERLFGEKVIDVALRKGVINRKTAEAARGILALRNLASHDRDVSLEKALDYLALADGVVYAIEVKSRFGTMDSYWFSTRKDD